MECRICRSKNLTLLWTDPDGFDWYLCYSCRSHTSTADYNPERYGKDYVDQLFAEEAPNALPNREPNLCLFERHANGKRGRFLDVGCGFGGSLSSMWSAGWDVMGFDIAFAGRPKKIVMAKEFTASLFWQRFEAVLCREVLEHVPNGEALLKELFLVAAPGGLVQVTTPKPMKHGRERFCYQWAHLVLWHPWALVNALRRVGFVVLETIVWEKGQLHLCQRPFLEGSK